MCEEAAKSCNTSRKKRFMECTVKICSHMKSRSNQEHEWNNNWSGVMEGSMYNEFKT